METCRQKFAVGDESYSVLEFPDDRNKVGYRVFIFGAGNRPTSPANVVLHIVSTKAFYQRVSIASYASAGIARAEMSVRLSVRLSVRPSHSGIVSKRRKLAS